MIVTILKWVLYIVVGGAAIDLFGVLLSGQIRSHKKKG